MNQKRRSVSFIGCRSGECPGFRGPNSRKAEAYESSLLVCLIPISTSALPENSFPCTSDERAERARASESAAVPEAQQKLCRRSFVPFPGQEKADPGP